MLRDNKAIWIIGANIALGVGLAAIGLALSRLDGVTYLGNSLAAWVACFCGGSVAILTQAFIACGFVVLRHGQGSDWPCLLGFLVTWLMPMFVRPNWPAPRQSLIRQVLAFRARLSDSPSDDASAACSTRSEAPKSNPLRADRCCAMRGWHSGGLARRLLGELDPARQIP